MEPDVRVVWMSGEVRTELQLRGQDTDGAFCLLVDHSPVGWSLPAHRHHNEVETIPPCPGRLRVDLDGVPSGISAGQSSDILRGVTHSSANIGSQTGCRVVLFSPAGMEGEIDLAAAAASATRHGWEFIG